MGDIRPCFVYAIATVKDGKPAPPVKIGISNMPYVRLKEMQTGSPAPLILVGMLMAPTREVALATEQFFHKCHPDLRKHGEWFSMSPWYAVGALGEFLGSEIDKHFGGDGLTNDQLMRRDT
jgi:hypothetical protein